VGFAEDVDLIEEVLLVVEVGFDVVRGLEVVAGLEEVVSLRDVVDGFVEVLSFEELVDSLVEVEVRRVPVEVNLIEVDELDEVEDVVGLVEVEVRRVVRVLDLVVEVSLDVEVDDALLEKEEEVLKGSKLVDEDDVLVEVLVFNVVLVTALFELVELVDVEVMYFVLEDKVATAHDSVLSVEYPTKIFFTAW
jgi:hypothetical protein